jgi:hypothetical protein
MRVVQWAANLHAEVLANHDDDIARSMIVHCTTEVMAAIAELLTVASIEPDELNDAA